jgi:hypothetical protein
MDLQRHCGNGDGTIPESIHLTMCGLFFVLGAAFGALMVPAAVSLAHWIEWHRRS